MCVSETVFNPCWELLGEMVFPVVGWCSNATFHRWNRIDASNHGLQHINWGFQWFLFAAFLDTLTLQVSTHLETCVTSPNFQSLSQDAPRLSNILVFPHVSGLHGCLQFHLLSGSHHGQTPGSVSPGPVTKMDLDATKLRDLAWPKETKHHKVG